MWVTDAFRDLEPGGCRQHTLLTGAARLLAEAMFARCEAGRAVVRMLTYDNAEGECR